MRLLASRLEVSAQPNSYYSTPSLSSYGQIPNVYSSPPSSNFVSSSPLQKRGAVADKAGAAVTVLLVAGLAKQLYSAIAPKFKASQPTTPAGPYVATPQYSPWQTRSFQDTKEDEQDSLFKRSIMNAAGHFVTVGFAFQALKDNTGPVLREMARLQHKATHQMKQLTTPAPIQQSQVQMYPPQRILYKREMDARHSKDSTLTMNEESEQALQRRGSFMSHPAVGHGLSAAGVLVTVSMLTGMGGPYLDQGLKKVKGALQKPQPAPLSALPVPSQQYTTAYAPQYVRKRSTISSEGKTDASDPEVAVILSEIKFDQKIVKRWSFKKWFKKVFNKASKIYNDKWVTKALAIVGWNGKMDLLHR